MAPPPLPRGFNVEGERERERGMTRERLGEKISVVLHVPYVGLYKYIP